MNQKNAGPGGTLRDLLAKGHVRPLNSDPSTCESWRWSVRGQDISCSICSQLAHDPRREGAPKVWSTREADGAGHNFLLLFCSCTWEPLTLSGTIPGLCSGLRAFPRTGPRDPSRSLSALRQIRKQEAPASSRQGQAMKSSRRGFAKSLPARTLQIFLRVAMNDLSQEAFYQVTLTRCLLVVIFTSCCRHRGATGRESGGRQGYVH